MKTLGNVMILNYYLRESSCQEKQPFGCWASSPNVIPLGVLKIKGRKGLSLKRWLMFTPEVGADFNTRSVNCSLQRHKGIPTEEKSEGPRLSQIIQLSRCGDKSAVGI